MGHYFGELVALEQCLLLASSDHLHRLERDGSEAWRTEQLGLDGVSVHEVKGELIAGAGEWDPPGGWRDFQVSLRTGAVIARG